MQAIATRLILITLLLSLAACGFQPRGAVPQLDNLPGPLFISGIDKYTPLHRELSRQLQAAGVSLSDSAGNAASLLRVRDHKQRRRVMSVDSTNQAVEYELEESLQFSVRHPSRGDIVADQTVRVLRVLYRPSGEVLAREREEEQLREDMRRDLVGRMLTRIKAQG